MNVFVLYYIIFDIIDNNNQDNSVDNDEIVPVYTVCVWLLYFFSAAIHLPLVRLCVPLWVNIAGRSAAYKFRISIIN